MLTMRAISLWQPWASLWLTERKVHETRHWSTKHRGWLIVHAAKKVDPGACQGLGMPDDVPRGVILGAVDLTDIISTNNGGWAHEDDLEAGNWGRDRFGWRRGRYVTLPVPIPYRGRQMLFNVPADDITTLLDLIPADDRSNSKHNNARGSE